MSKKIIFIVLLSLLTFNVFAQLDEGAVFVDYAIAPVSEDGVDFSKISAKFSSPLKLKKGVLVNSVGVDYFQMNYHDNFEIETQDLENLYNINYNLRYVYPLVNKWALIGQVGTSLSSNLRSSIQSDDFIFTGGINAVKIGGTLENPSRLVFGLNYITLIGKPRILPMISYLKKVNDKFSYGLGFPNTHAKYNFSEKHSLKSLIWVNGFYTNLGDPIFINSNMKADKASYRAISLGLEYNYALNKRTSVILKGGYNIYNEYLLLDMNNNEVYNFNTASEPYFSIGLKFK